MIASSSENRPRIADRLAAARRARFVGRSTELELFRGALLAEDPPFLVLHIYGPGGVGKTSLLHEYARISAECGRHALSLDGRNIDPTPPGLLVALRQALGLNGDHGLTIRDVPNRSVLLIDTYESIAALDAWLRNVLLPQLPAQTVVVICGRNTPDNAWRTDIDWSQLTRIIQLGNLQPDEGRTYLATQGIAEDLHARVLAVTRGQPLALALVADVMRQNGRLEDFSLDREPEIVRALLERMVQGVPDSLHRQALWVSVLAWATTEALLVEVLQVPDAHDLFEWLRGLSFVEEGPYGLFPHDLARDVLDADLRWRNPDIRARLGTRLASQLYARFQRARGVEQQRVWFDLLYLNRSNPSFRPYFEWTALGSAYAEPATPADFPAILAMVEEHQGGESLQIARHWLRRQPDAFLAFRDVTGELLGFMAHIALEQATAEDLRVDPAARAALDYVHLHGPLQAGEEIVYLRFWMSKTAHQRVSAAINLTAINASIYWTTHPRLAWNFIAIADPDFYEPHFTSIQMWRAPEADFEVDGHRFGVFAHDWRLEPVSEWMTVKTESVTGNFGRAARPSAAQARPTEMTRAEFAQAVRQALRDYTRPDQLARNPLLHSRLCLGSSDQNGAPERLRQMLLETVTNLRSSPKDTKLHRALWHTYIEPAATQELAAELLDLPFGTYRYQLANGIERVTDALWQRRAISARQND